MKVEKGQYIRTKCGCIGKITGNNINISGFYKIKYNNYEGYIDKDDIKTVKDNIIDLIEVEDRVNGYKITDKSENNVYVEGTMCTYKINDIYEILTHEHYEKWTYKLEMLRGGNNL